MRLLQLALQFSGKEKATVDVPELTPNGKKRPDESEWPATETGPVPGYRRKEPTK